MMRILGYARTGSVDRSIDNQLELLRKFDAGPIYQDVSPGVKDARPQWDALLSEVKAGDTVVVTSLVHLALNTKQLFELTETFEERQVSLRVLDCELDTSNSSGKKMLSMLKAVVDLERNLAAERQADGIARAKAEGKYLGRKPTARAKSKQIVELAEQGLTRQAIADRLKIGVASVYRVLRDHRDPEKTLVVEQKAEAKPVRKTVAKKKSAPKAKSTANAKPKTKAKPVSKPVVETKSQPVAVKPPKKKKAVKPPKKKKAAKPKKKAAEDVDQFSLPF